MELNSILSELIISCFVVLPVLAKKEYIRDTDIVVNHGFKMVTYVTSAISCCAMCRDSRHRDDCVSVSYNRNTNICQLNDRNPFFDATASKTSLPGWNSYYELCEPDWTPFRGSCYLLVTTHQDWQASELNCQGQGGHLVDIHDEDEVFFLDDLLKQSSGDSFVWIGLHDINVEGVFSWTSGATVEYTHFKDPRFWVGPAYNCGYTHRHSGLWDTLSCTRSFISFCEIKM